jgi:hypothetical protein
VGLSELGMSPANTMAAAKEPVVHGSEETGKTASGVAALSERQRMLIEVIQTLDPALRHTLEIECRGTEPWNVSVIRERRDIQLKAGAKPEAKH